jgi:poly-beta-1,6-N-acetyl-D-glucosamine synthase
MIEFITQNIWGVTGVVLFVLAWIIQEFYFLNYFLRTAHKEKPLNAVTRPVSIVVCARNEEKNLMNHVPMIMEQHYPNFEVVVVNDSSWDDTEGILKALQVQYPALRVVNLDEEKQNMQGKKFALTLGIKAAKHETIVLIDADCAPASNQWLMHMVSQMTDKQQIVLGVSPYLSYPGWLNRIIRYDTLLIAASYCGFARAGKPYMGVGRNLAYTKEIFFKVGGFRNHYSIASGDDDLFINQVATPQNTIVVTAPPAQTFSEPKRTWKDWFAQKSRHLTTLPMYKQQHKNMLMLWPLSFGFLYIGFVLVLVFQTYVLLVSALLFLRYVTQIVTLHKVATRLAQRKDLVWLAPILEAHLHMLNLGLYLTNLVRKPQKWN